MRQLLREILCLLFEHRLAGPITYCKRCHAADYDQAFRFFLNRQWLIKMGKYYYIEPIEKEDTKSERTGSIHQERAGKAA